MRLNRVLLAREPGSASFYSVFKPGLIALRRPARRRNRSKTTAFLLAGGLLRGGCGRLTIPGGRQFCLDFSQLSRLHRLLLAVRRKVVNRQVAAGFLRPLGSIGRQADRRHISDLGRAAAKRQRRSGQRGQRPQPYRSTCRHPSRNPQLPGHRTRIMTSIALVRALQRHTTTR